MEIEVINQIKQRMYGIVGAMHEVHSIMGPGLNEYCYQEALEEELKLRAIPYQRESSFHPIYKGKQLEAEYRLDFLCYDNIIIECKSIQKLGLEQRVQLFNYMRLKRVPAGILVNFGPSFAQIERYFYDVEKEEICSSDGEPLSSLRK